MEAERVKRRLEEVCESQPRGASDDLSELKVFGSDRSNLLMQNGDGVGMPPGLDNC